MYKLKMNTLLKLLHKFPNKDWDWISISKNPNITEEFVLSHLELPWRWEHLHSKISIKIIQNNPELQWDYSWINNLFLTKEDINTYIDKLHGNSLSGNPNITEDIILKYPRKRWNLSELSKNPNISIKFIEKYLIEKNPFDGSIIGFKKICLNPNISEEFILKHFHLLNLTELSQNSNLPDSIILQYPTAKWHWESLSKNRSLKFIKDNLNNDIGKSLVYNLNTLKSNPNIYNEVIIEYDLNAEYNNDLNSEYDDEYTPFTDILNDDLSITTKIIYNNNNKNKHIWKHIYEISDPNIPISNIIPINYICTNPALTEEIVHENLHLINFEKLSLNKFKYDIRLFKMYIRRIQKIKLYFNPIIHYKFISAIKTQKFWIWYCSNIGKEIDHNRIKNFMKHY